MWPMNVSRMSPRMARHGRQSTAARARRKVTAAGGQTREGLSRATGRHLRVAAGLPLELGSDGVAGQVPVGEVLVVEVRVIEVLVVEVLVVGTLVGVVIPNAAIQISAI